MTMLHGLAGPRRPRLFFATTSTSHDLAGALARRSSSSSPALQDHQGLSPSSTSSHLLLSSSSRSVAAPRLSLLADGAPLARSLTTTTATRVEHASPLPHDALVLYQQLNAKLTTSAQREAVAQALLSASDEPVFVSTSLVGQLAELKKKVDKLDKRDKDREKKTETLEKQVKTLEAQVKKLNTVLVPTRLAGVTQCVLQTYLQALNIVVRKGKTVAPQKDKRGAAAPSSSSSLLDVFHENRPKTEPAKVSASVKGLEAMSKVLSDKEGKWVVEGMAFGVPRKVFEQTDRTVKSFYMVWREERNSQVHQCSVGEVSAFLYIYKDHVDSLKRPGTPGDAYRSEKERLDALKSMFHQLVGGAYDDEALVIEKHNMMLYNSMRSLNLSKSAPNLRVAAGHAQVQDASSRPGSRESRRTHSSSKVGIVPTPKGFSSLFGKKSGIGRKKDPPSPLSLTALQGPLSVHRTSTSSDFISGGFGMGDAVPEDFVGGWDEQAQGQGRSEAQEEEDGFPWSRRPPDIDPPLTACESTPDDELDAWLASPTTSKPRKKSYLSSPLSAVSARASIRNSISPSPRTSTSHSVSESPSASVPFPYRAPPSPSGSPSTLTPGTATTTLSRVTEPEEEGDPLQAMDSEETAM
ncbi:hypothetical protein MNV49_005049 [Pseudohyphozyma bogoriensis]|nr:hypothetical protein MNV49_005049 [Pseudohyphozyma bogoriensis]